MNNIYKELGLIEAAIISTQEQLKQLKIRKNFLIETLKDLQNANQDIHTQTGREDSTGTQSEAQ